MIGLLWWLFSLPRAEKPAPFVRPLPYAASLAQINGWNRERLDLNPALRRSR